ncbi:CAP domain-containing protein [Mumia sp. ZJ430]|uniref:CAP domain-containing protein n=1 Tax=Mumia sp. ZJ430 TaxID=2708083 RepID=UPI00141E2868|nr:CAP domain-containing protein [Mumia sp. ZJ430]
MIAPYGRPRRPTAATPKSAVLALAGVLVAATAMLFAAAPPASAAPADTIASLANDARAAQGASPLARNAALDAVARGWAHQMASNGSLSHNPDVADEIPSGWRRVGENVAQGYRTAAQMHSGWMNSSGHRANILGDYTDIGVAFIESGGTTWGVQVFANYPNGSGARPAPPTPSATTTATSRPKPTATATTRKPASAPRPPKATPTRTPSPTATKTTPTPTPTPSPTPSVTASQAAAPGTPSSGPGQDPTREVVADAPAGRAIDPVVLTVVGLAALLAAIAALVAWRRHAVARDARHRG